VVPDAPYSPDLAPSDFFLFPNLKKWLGGRRFTSNEEVIAETNGYFAELEESYCEGIKKLEHRWTKCTDLEGDNVEKFKKKNKNLEFLPIPLQSLDILTLPRSPIQFYTPTTKYSNIQMIFYF
jgi:hypothetical protein